MTGLQTWPLHPGTLRCRWNKTPLRPFFTTLCSWVTAAFWAIACGTKARENATTAVLQRLFMVGSFFHRAWIGCVLQNPIRRVWRLFPEKVVFFCLGKKETHGWKPVGDQEKH